MRNGSKLKGRAYMPTMMKGNVVVTSADGLTLDRMLRLELEIALSGVAAMVELRLK